MNKQLKHVPEFVTEEEERTFWEAEDNDSTQYLDWPQGQRATFPRLKPSTKSISLRLPETLLANIKSEANRRDVPYQSPIKIWLAERVQTELDQ